MAKAKWKTETRKGFKFLDGSGATPYRGTDFYYNLPRIDQKWSDWQVFPEPATKKDNSDCGPGGFHVMKKLDASYAPDGWWVWFAEGRGIVGESDEKFRCLEIRLRRISIKALWHMARKGYLRRANLNGANLYGANLDGANLRRANLYGANLRRANLDGANLRWANLRRANLYGANLDGANLRRANLRWANLDGANLDGAIHWEHGLMSDATRKLFEKANR